MLTGAVTAFLLAAAPAAAQTFKGKGSEATKTFPLAEGLVIFEVEHRGDGSFVVKLVDEQGNTIGEVARGAGVFGGSKAIQIPRTGSYRFDVEAPGEWTVRWKSAEVAEGQSESAEAGRRDGGEDGGRPGTSGWLGRGLLGGLLGGPIGTGLVVSRVEGATSRDADAAVASRPMDDLAYAAAYREAFTNRLRSRRQRSAVIGGALGTSALVFTLIQVIDLGTSGENTDLSGGDPGVPLILVPIRF